MNSSKVKITKIKDADKIIPKFSFTFTRKGAMIFGAAAGLMVWMQGLAFAASYTGDIARAKFATTLANNAGLGILYGETRSIETPAGYMVYRTLPFLALIGAIWALTITTKLLRGQEEDGRLEIMLIGKNTLGGLTGEIIKGFAYSLGIAFLICTLLLIALGQFEQINVSVTSSVFFALAIFMPVLVFASIGTLASQLAATRRRAMFYGSIFLVISFVLRSIGNVIDSLSWLKYLSPFGWADRMHAVTGSSWLWLVPAIIFTTVCLLLAIYNAKNRDLYESTIPDKITAKPRYRLLGSPLGLSFRLNRTTLLGWLFAVIGICALMTGIAKTAVSAVIDSPELTKAFGKITGANNSLMLAFIGFSGFMAALLLMIVAANGIGRFRDDEARGYLDNFLVSSVSRSKLISQRALLILISIILICSAGNITSWLIAKSQDISVTLGSLMIGGLNFIAPALLITGFGALVYGLKPRWVSLTLYAWIAWSFVVEMIGSVVNLSSLVINTSLLRQISSVPAVETDWRKFVIVTFISIVAFAFGLVFFNRRDIVTE